MTLILRPITLRAANAFVSLHHRHHPAVRGCKFTLALYDNDRLCAVAIVGRPVARNLDDGITAELTRLCTDGTRNAASKLLAAVRRAAQSLGYVRTITYTLQSESGDSLRASGYRALHQIPARSWNRHLRPRTDRHRIESRTMWEA